MRKMTKKVLAFSLSAAMVFSMTACGDSDKNPSTTPTPEPTSSESQTTPEPTKGGETDTTTTPEPTKPVVEWDLTSQKYIYKDAVSTLPAYWNPHDYETLDDAYMQGYIDAGFYEFIFNDDLNPLEGKDPYTGYVIVPYMAASMPVDVTEAIKSSHPQYGIPESATSGYAYTIDLNPDAKWQDGTPINADSYIYSMKALLDPKMINYRAADYFSGDFVIAGAEDYFYGGRTELIANSTDGSSMKYAIADLVKGDDGVYKTADGLKVLIGLNEGYAWMGGDSLADYQGAGYVPGEGCWDILSAAADEKGFVPVTDDTLNALFTFTNSDVWGNETYEQLGYYLSYEKTFEEKSFDTVGLFKSGDYQITIVFDHSLAGFNLLYSLTSNWLVYEPLYEACKTETNGSWTTNYFTSVDTTISYGPYKLTSYQTGKALRLERNENWFGWTDDKHVYVDPEDGETYRMYQTDIIDCQVVEESATRKMMFLKGELMGYGLQIDDMDEYRSSDYAYVTPGTTIFFFIFNGYKDALEEREAAADFDTTKFDLQTMTLESFRRAIAVTYDKEAFCAAVNPARSGGYGLIGTGYIYDPETGAEYRSTEQAKKVLCDFYSVDTSKYATLDDAVASITGYDPVKAKELFTTAYNEAIAAGYITDADGDGLSDQTIRIEYALSSDSDFYTKTIDYLNSKLNDVTAGTPFDGKIEFCKSAPYGNDWSTKLKNGLSDTVLAGWSGSKMNPFSLTRLYTSPDNQYDAKWFNAESVSMTLEVNTAKIGEPEKKETLTTNLAAWSDALNGSTITIDGKEYCFGEGIADVDTRLEILAGIEGKVLNTYDYIPMIQDAGLSLLSQQVFYVIEEYNAVLSRGGIQYMKYNYDEAEWAAYIAEQGGELSY